VPASDDVVSSKTAPFASSCLPSRAKQKLLDSLKALGDLAQQHRQGLGAERAVPSEVQTSPWTDGEIAAAKAECTATLSGVRLDFEPLGVFPLGPPGSYGGRGPCPVPPERWREIRIATRCLLFNQEQASQIRTLNVGF
jgi:hypothetical protein